MTGSKKHQETLAKALQEKTGHAFLDLARLERAMTHASARNKEGSDYERLEFLGDRVLGLVVAELLFAKFPNADEGELSIRLNSLVDAETCAEIADDLDLHLLIRKGSDMGQLDGKRLSNVRADVVESLIATIYMDGGLAAARPFIEAHWGPRAVEVDAGRRDAKTELQEWAHREGGVQPTYSVIRRTGPDHEPVFSVQLSVPGFSPETADGPSKRLAERDAAEKMLIREGVWTDAE
jgi:ribonuclease III